MLNSQSLADGRVTLGVLGGLKRIYQPHGLPPCISGQTLNWVDPASAVELAA